MKDEEIVELGEVDAQKAHSPVVVGKSEANSQSDGICAGGGPKQNSRFSRIWILS